MDLSISYIYYTFYIFTAILCNLALEVKLNFYIFTLTTSKTEKHTQTRDDRKPWQPFIQLSRIYTISAHN